MRDIVKIKLADDLLFDKLVHNALSDCADVTMVTKDVATRAGRPAVCISFTVQLPNGDLARAQTVITGRNFAAMVAAFRGRYGTGGDAVCTADYAN